MSDPRRAEAPVPLLPIAVLLVTMVACSTLPKDDADTGAPMPSGSCNAEGARWAIGQAPSNEVIERARTESGSKDVRVLRPGDAVDFRADRLNIDVNDRGAITGLRCG